MSIRGYSTRKNPKNLFKYVRIHWSADPARDEQWREMMIARNGPRDFAISHDLQRVQMGGQGVFSDLYIPEEHEIDTYVAPDPRFGPVILGWDFGGNHSIVVGQRQGREIHIIEEYPNMGFGTKDIARQVYEELTEKWQHLGLHFIDAIDPAGKDAGKESDAKSCADMLIAQARTMGRTSQDVRIPRTNLITPRLEAVRSTLRGEPYTLRVGPNCPFLRRAMRGAYCWPEKIGKGRKAEPEKNDFSHIVDGLGYLILVINTLKAHDIAVKTPRGRYSYYE